MPEPIVIQLPAPIRTVEVVARAAKSPETRSSPALPAEVRAAMEEAQARLEEEHGRLVQTRTALAKAVEDLRRAEREVLAGAEAQVVELSLAIAGKVLMQEIEAGRFQMEPIVREALRHMPTGRDIIIHLSPPDAALWHQAERTPAANLKVVADAGLCRGDCRVETTEATVLATVPQRLEAVARSLRQAGPA